MTYIRKKKPRTRSWHLLRTWTRVPRRAIAMCERTILVDEESKKTPQGKTCESCYRAAARTQEGS